MIFLTFMKYFIGCNKQFFQIKFHPYRRYLLRPIEFISPYPLPFLPFKFLNIVKIKNVTNKGHCKGIPAKLLRLPAYPKKELQKDMRRPLKRHMERHFRIYRLQIQIYIQCVSPCVYFLSSPYI